MKLPSLSHAVVSARETFMRFPFVILDALLGTVCSVLWIDYAEHAGPTALVPVIFGAALGFPLLAGLALLAEKWKLGRASALGLQAAGILVAALYALTVPRDLSVAPNYHTLQLLMLIAGMTFFLFSAPYLWEKSETGYWNFCKTLLQRILTAALFTFVLWIGLSVALMAFDKLFGVDVPGKRYPELWVLLTGTFATWFALAGVPGDLDGLDRASEYPKGLKIFSQYILVPLVLIYLVILSAYLGKILWTWEWPQGWVSGLILGFMATGFASLLLMHPIKDRAENSWIKKAAMGFYLILIPFTVMLFLAIWQRVAQYGVTESRYLGLAVVVWLCVVIPYFIFSREKRIIVLAASLCVGLLVVSLGPWGMFSVSEKSQVGRLREILAGNHILVDGRVQAGHGALQFQASREISSILFYLSDVHGYDAIQPWFGESLKRGVPEKTAANKEPADVAALMGVKYVASWWQTPSGKGVMMFRADRDAALEITGYDRLLRDLYGLGSDATRAFANEGITVRTGSDACVMTITVSRERKTVDSLRIDLKPMVEGLMAEYERGAMDRVRPEKMSVEVAGQTIALRLYLTTLRVQRREGGTKVESFDAVIAYKN